MPRATKCKNSNKWPEIDKNKLRDEIKLAIQVNGKTRDIIVIKKDLDEKRINEIVYTQSKAKKYIDKNKIIKTIFVKNRIINYIV